MCVQGTDRVGRESDGVLGNSTKAGLGGGTTIWTPQMRRFLSEDKKCQPWNALDGSNVEPMLAGDQSGNCETDGWSMVVEYDNDADIRSK